ncbi:MAG TPA: M23 family metallopeptidase [Rectinemataceae bacterium]|nr:M23 family metallopeptidase [Rectinemataceae bacterium]
MDTETDRIKGKRDSASRAQFRPKPFLTILDGKPASVGKERRPSGHRPAKSIIKKAGIKFQSYADEGFRTVASKGKARLSATARILANIPTNIFRLKPKATPAAPLPTSERMESSAEADRRENVSPGKQSGAARMENIRVFAARLKNIGPVSSPVRRIILSVLIAAIVISAGAAAIIGATSFPVSSGSLILPDEESAQAALMAYLEPDSSDKDILPAGALPPIPVSVNIRSYSVKSGDSLEKIAKRFGLRQDTIISSNNLQSSSSIRPGIQLRIPNMDGVSHKVRKGESLLYLAKTYSIDITRIVDANDLASGTINVGQSLFIPNARLSSATLRNFYGERFIWPARGGVSSSFGYRANPFTGLRTYHSAIDIVVSLGTKVKATSDGSVADTGYNSVFGNYVILKHASGYQSLYAHLSHISVKEGASISQGAIIGLSGNTGQSTGPHLHFSIFKNGQALDPTKYVK